jgi:hypothetical protein
VVQELADYQPRQDGAQDVVQELADYQPTGRRSFQTYQPRYLSSSEPNSLRSFHLHFLPLALEYLQFHQRIQKQYRKPHQHTHLLCLGIRVLSQPDRQ